MKIMDETLEFHRKSLQERLAKCTDDQRAFFKMIFPEGPKDNQLISAIDLCDRTINHNSLLE